MVDLLTLFDFNEGPSCTPNIFQIKYSTVELNLSVISRNTLI